MKNKINLVLITMLLLSSTSFAQKKSKKDYLITMQTNKGTMRMILFEDTPLHRANFLSLVEAAKFDSVIFHRVIKNFMIQGGNLGLKKGKKPTNGEELELIPYEFTTNHIHTRGALAAARTNNPQKASSGSQFYIVTGKKYTDEELNKTIKNMTSIPEAKNNPAMTYTTKQRQDYMIIGGTPFLDNNYTVFGQVIEGLDIAGMIESVQTGPGDRPAEDIWMVMTAKKMRKKKISKIYGYEYQ